MNINDRILLESAYSQVGVVEEKLVLKKRLMEDDKYVLVIVSDTASNGAANLRTPSARLVIRLADQMREKSLPSELRVGTVGNSNC